MHKARTMKKYFSGWKNVSGLQRALNLIQHLWEHVLGARLYHPTSVPDLTNVLEAEKEQSPVAVPEEWRHGIRCIYMGTYLCLYTFGHVVYTHTHNLKPIRGTHLES